MRAVTIIPKMRNILSVLALLIFNSHNFYGQISQYYQSAIGLSDAELKTALHNIIDDHNTFPYTSGGTDVWDILKETDRDPQNSDNVIMIYSGRSINAEQEYNNGNGWTREHVWAKSYGDFGTSQGAGTDVHHLRPLENSVNSTRNNRAFANCNSCEEVYFEGFATGSYIDTEEWIFEPRDEVKGDVARMIFYMALRYEGDDANPDLELSETLLPQGSSLPLHGILSDLLQWNLSDPVSEWEIIRNDIIYSQFQGNRNPFIDHPELAGYLWGELSTELWPQTSNGLADNTQKEFRLFPNPATGIVKCSSDYSHIEIVDQTGRMVCSFFQNETINIEHLPQGVYFARVFTKNGFVLLTKVVKI